MKRFSCCEIFNKTALLLLSLVLSLLISEIILRSFFPAYTRYYVWPPNLRYIFRPDPNVMPGVYGEARFFINSQGMRGDEILPGSMYRILAFGGSTTECLYLDQSKAWPYLLQQRLNEYAQDLRVWVGNIGRSGRTTRDHLLQMRYLLPQHPEIDAVIMLIGVNDFTIRLAQDVGYDPHSLDRSGSEELQLDNAFNRRPMTSQVILYKRTAIWRFARQVRMHFLSLPIQDEVGEMLVRWRRNRQYAIELRSTPPNLSSALDEYSRNINEIIDIAKKRSVRIIFVTHPVLWKPNLSQALKELLWFGGIGNYQMESDKIYYSVEALADGMKIYNETLLRICQMRQTECFDLAALLPSDTTVFYDDVHFNESGAQKGANALAEYLLHRKPFKQHDK